MIKIAETQWQKGYRNCAFSFEVSTTGSWIYRGLANNSCLDWRFKCVITRLVNKQLQSLWRRTRWILFIIILLWPTLQEFCREICFGNREENKQVLITIAYVQKNREILVKLAKFPPFPVMRLKRVYRSCSGREQFHLRYWNWYWHCLTARVAPYLILAMTSRFSSHRAFCSIFKSGIPSQNRLTVPNIYNWCGIPSDLFG